MFLYFAGLDLCNYDVLKIVDGSRTSSYCEGGTPSDYTSSGNKISIVFQSDSSLQLKGFSISFSTFNVEPSGSKWQLTRVGNKQLQLYNPVQPTVSQKS